MSVPRRRVAIRRVPVCAEAVEALSAEAVEALREALNAALTTLHLHLHGSSAFSWKTALTTLKRRSTCLFKAVKWKYVCLDFTCFDDIYTAARYKGLDAFVMFWNHLQEHLDFFSLPDFAVLKNQLALAGMLVERTIVRKYKEGFVEYVIFNQYQEEPNKLALDFTGTKIYRLGFYVICYPKESFQKFSPEFKRNLEMKFEQNENDVPDFTGALAAYHETVRETERRKVKGALKSLGKTANESLLSLRDI